MTLLEANEVLLNMVRVSWKSRVFIKFFNLEQIVNRGRLFRRFYPDEQIVKLTFIKREFLTLSLLGVVRGLHKSHLDKEKKELLLTLFLSELTHLMTKDIFRDIQAGIDYTEEGLKAYLKGDTKGTFEARVDEEIQEQGLNKSLKNDMTLFLYHSKKINLIPSEDGGLIRSDDVSKLLNSIDGAGTMPVSLLGRVGRVYDICNAKAKAILKI